MKSFLEKSKRALVLLLTGTMIATSLPSNAFAATVDGDDEILFEDTQDVVDNLGEVIEEDPVEPDNAKAEIEVVFVDDDSATDVLNAYIYDYNDVRTYAPLVDVDGSGDVAVAVDPEKAYSFVVEPKEGLAFSAAKPLTVTGAYKTYATGVTSNDATVTATVTDVPATEAEYYNKGSKLVTISAESLTAVLDGMDNPSVKTDDGILTLKFANPATPATWKISGFDLKDVTQKASFEPGNLTLTNGTTKQLDLANVLEIGSLNKNAFEVRVIAYNENDVMVLDSGVLGSTALSSDTTDVSKWAAVYPAYSESDKITWARYTGTGGVLEIDGDAISYLYNQNYKVFVDVTAGGIGAITVKATEAAETVATFAADPGYNSSTQNTGVIDSTNGYSDTPSDHKDFVFTATLNESDASRIHSVYYGTPDGFVDYWNSIYIGDNKTKGDFGITGSTRVFGVTVDFKDSTDPSSPVPYGYKITANGKTNAAYSNWSVSGGTSEAYTTDKIRTLLVDESTFGNISDLISGDVINENDVKSHTITLQPVFNGVADGNQFTVTLGDGSATDAYYNNEGTECEFIDSVTWTVDGKSDASYKQDISAGTTTTTVTIPNAHLKKGNVVVNVTGAYSVTNLGGSSAFSVLDKDGVAITQVGSGKDLVFQVVAANGKKVNSVSYTIGGGASQSATLGTDGCYTISNVTGKVVINASTGNASMDADKIVKTAANYNTEVVVTKLDNGGGTVIPSGGTATREGEPLLFTVTPDATHVVEKVTYTMGSTTNAVLTPVYGKTYKIANVTDDVTISVTYRSATKVHAPSNSNVTVDFAAVGGYVTKPQGAFTFTVTPAKENVKITSVSYSTSNAKGTVLSGTTGGTITLGAATDYYIYVETEETVSTENYRAVFANGKITTTYEEGKAKTALNITDQTLKLVMGDTSQTITATYPAVKENKLRANISDGSDYMITAPESTQILDFTGSNSTGTIKIAPKKVGEETVTITCKKVAAGSFGNTLVYPGTLNVTVTQAYSELKLNSSLDTAYTFTGTNDADNLDVVKLELMGKNGQTGLFGNVSPIGTGNQVTSVAWSFDPSTASDDSSAYTHSFVAGATASTVTLGSSTASTSTNTVYVCANKPETVKVRATVTFKDGSEETVEKTLTFINPVEEKYFMTRKISGAFDSFELLQYGDLDNNIATPDEFSPAIFDDSNAITLGLNTTDKKDVTVKYDLYRIVKTTLVPANYDEESEIKTLLTKGDIVVVDNATIGEAKITNRTTASLNPIDINDKNEYATLASGTDGYTVTAVKEITNGNIIRLDAPDVTISGVKIPTLNFANRSVTFDIDNKISRYKVELITIDDQSTNNAVAVNEVQTLSDAFINGRDYSKVNVTYGSTKKQAGIEFNEIAEGVSFKLPEESDFATKPYTNKMLLGWAETSWSEYGPGAVIDGYISAADNLADYVYAPGEYITVSANSSFKAIWSDRYVKYDRATKKGSTAGGDSTIYLYDTTKAYVGSDGKTVYPELVAASVQKGQKIPVVVGLGKVKGVTSGQTAAVFDITSVPYKVDVTKLDVEEVFDDANFTLTADGENSEYNLNATSLTAKTIEATENAGTSANTIKVEWSDPDTKHAGDKYSANVSVTFTDAKAGIISWDNVVGTSIESDKATIKDGGVPITLTAGLVDKGVHNTSKVVLTAANGSNTAPNARYYNYTYNWSSSVPTVATVKAGETTAQNTVTITPVGEGKTTITLSVMKSGKELAKKSFELTVEAADVMLVFADLAGNTGITEVQAHAGKANTGVFKVKATDKTGKALTGGTFSFGETGAYNTSKVIAASQTGKTVAAGGDDGFFLVPVDTRDFIGTDVLHVQYSDTISGQTVAFQKDINVKTYYSITLDPSADAKIFITKDGAKQFAADGKSQTPVEIKLFEEDMKDVVSNIGSDASAQNKKNFNFKAISLAGYSAVYNDETTKKDFSNWETDNATSNPAETAGTKKTYKEDETISKLVGFTYGDGLGVSSNDKSAFNAGAGTYVLKPVMAQTLTLTGVPGEITMNYSTTPANNSKTVNLTIDPSSYNTALTVKGSKSGFYSINNGAANDDALIANVKKTSTPNGTDGKAKFILKAYTFVTEPHASVPGAATTLTYDPSDKTTWRAGTDTLGIYGPNENKPLASINLYVNGLNYDTSTKKVQYFENGDIIKSDYRTVNDNTYYFDAEGNWIETTGITQINGKSVLIIDGVVASKGKRVHEGNTYFVGDNGVIQTGWLTSAGAAATATDGVYYADPAADGKLVSGVQTIDSKKYVFGTDNKVSRASASAKDYELLNGFYVNAAGEIAENGIFKVNDVNRLFRENGSIVLFTDTDVEKNTADVEHGVITVNGIKYIIEKDTNKAERDDILYNAKVTWTVGYPNKVTKGTAAPELKYTITYTSKNTGATTTTDPISVIATTTDNFTAGSTAEEVTFTATPDLTGYFADAEGKTPATADAKTIKYRFKDGGPEGISDIWYAPSVTWTTVWQTKWTKETEYPVMKYKVTYTSKETGTSVTTDELLATVTASPAPIASDAKEATFTATADLSQYYTDETGATAVDPAAIANSSISRKYNFKDGGAEGVAGTYTYKSHTFTWGALASKDATAPTVTAKVVYTLTLEDGTKSIEEVTTTPSIKEETTTAKDRRTFTATISTMDEKVATVFETKTYSIKGDTPATGGLEGLVVEGLEDEYYYTGAAIKPAFRLVDYDIEDGVVLGLGTDYTVSYKNPAAKDINNAKDATGTIIINGKGNYDGKKLQVSFKIVNALKSSDDVTNVATSVKKIAASKEKFTFTGAPQAPATLTITTEAGDLTYTYDATTNEYTKATEGESKDVIVTVSNNINAGTAAIAAVGTDGKIKKATFKIAKFNLKKASADQIAVVVNGGEDVPFSAFSKGAQPLVEATFTAAEGATPVDMVAGNDFTVTYKNNKTAGSGSVTLKGKNNFAGTTATATSFNIEKFDLSQVNEDDVVVNAYANLATTKVDVTFTDSYGNTIPKKAYTVTVAGAANKKLAAGEKLTITVAAKDATSYENSFEISDFEVLTGINKAKLTYDKNYAKANIVYTGEPVILTELLDSGNLNPFESGKIVVKIGKTVLKYGEDYEVVGYANNIKKGDMTVNLRGIGSYTGYAKGTVKIAAKPITKITAE